MFWRIWKNDKDQITQRRICSWFAIPYEVHYEISGVPEPPSQLAFACSGCCIVLVDVCWLQSDHRHSQAEWGRVLGINQGNYGQSQKPRECQSTINIWEYCWSMLELIIFAYFCQFARVHLFLPMYLCWWALVSTFVVGWVIHYLVVWHQEQRSFSSDAKMSAYLGWCASLLRGN